MSDFPEEERTFLIDIVLGCFRRLDNEIEQSYNQIQVLGSLILYTTSF